MAFHTSRSTRHAASDKRIIDRLERHAELMKKFERQGFSREEASKKAFEEMERKQ